MRVAGLACLSVWASEVGMNSLFEQDIIAPSLATENPNLRSEV